jgi:hypothetical protein
MASVRMNMGGTRRTRSAASRWIRMGQSIPEFMPATHGHVSDQTMHRPCARRPWVGAQPPRRREHRHPTWVPVTHKPGTRHPRLNLQAHESVTGVPEAGGRRPQARGWRSRADGPHPPRWWTTFTALVHDVPSLVCQVCVPVPGIHERMNSVHHARARRSRACARRSPHSCTASPRS